MNRNIFTLDQYLRPADKSRLGLHHSPVPYHDNVDLTSYLDKYRMMGIRWVTILDDGGGSTLQPSSYYQNRCILDLLLEREIIPIIRFYVSASAQLDMRMEETAKRLVDKGVRYIFWQNEPEIPLEWDNKQPKDWLRIVFRNFVTGAYKLIKLGAYPGLAAFTSGTFYDENGQKINPFLTYMTNAEREDIFIYGPGWCAIHNYALNKDTEYPYDAVNLYGKPLTHEEYIAKLNEVDAGYRQRTGRLWVWENWETNEHHINLQRSEGKNPNATLESDDACFRMYENFNKRLEEAGLLNFVPIISTECGPSVGDKPKDGRYPRVTPKWQIEMVQAQLSVANRVPNYFAMTFWLAGVKSFRAERADGFEPNAWWTHMHDEPFNINGELPIVQNLIDNHGVNMRNVLGFHIQVADSTLLPLIARVQMPVIKTMDLNPEWCRKIKAMSPSSLLVARAWIDNQDRYKTNPMALISEMLGLYAPVADIVDFIEVPNEVINNSSTLSDIAAWDQFQVTFCEETWKRWPRLRVGLFNLPTGNLGWDGEWGLQDFPKSMALDTNRTAIFIHEYSYKSMQYQAGARCLRFFRQMVGFPNHKVVISEAGVTKMVLDGKNDVGWRNPDHGDRTLYVNDLIWYNRECAKYGPNLLGVVIFNCGSVSHGWDSFRSENEVMEAIAKMSTNEPPPPVIDEPPKPSEQCNDAVSYGVSVQMPENLVIGETYWAVTKVHHLTPDENNGNHHVFLDVLDGEGQRKLGARVQVENSYHNVVIAVVDKPMPNLYGADVAMYGHETTPPNYRTVRVIDSFKSSVVCGIHPAHAGEYKADGSLGSSLFHHSFSIVFEPKVYLPAEPPTPPKGLSETEARDLGWNALGIPWNPDAAFFKKAKQLGLKVPRTPEFRKTINGVVYAAQVFDDSVLYCVDGQYDQIWVVSLV